MKASPVVRLICGLLGFAGAAAIAVNATGKGGIVPDFTFLSSLLGTFFFLYVAFFGESATGEPDATAAGKEPMTRRQWQVFWTTFVASILSMTFFLKSKGVFDSGSLVVLLIVGVSFALIGAAIYFFVKGRTDEFW